VASAGDVFQMPDGAQYVLRTPAAEANGEYVEFEWIFPAGVFAPPPHLHPAQVEEYEVLEGQFDVMVDGVWQTLREGESASVPIGVNHTFRRTTQPVRVRNFHRPALGFEAFIETTCRALADRGITRLRDPRVPLLLAQTWRAHPETLHATRARDRAAMAAAAAIGRVLRVQVA
jgi:mannose-6-phosphate isomerase-like protein (cupin superfamily)